MSTITMMDAQPEARAIPIKIKGKFSTNRKAKNYMRMKNLNRRKESINESIDLSDHAYAQPEREELSTYPDSASAPVQRAVEGDIEWCEGRRVVELKHLADSLVCIKCGHLLHLRDTVGEKRYGLGSLLYVLCKHPSCMFENTIPTGKRNDKGAFDINSKVTLAMIHSGMGPSNVMNFLTTCNIPPIDATTLKKKEKQISAAIESQAKESCKKARAEEIAASQALECSFDAGWQTRGSGCQYNSNTGHASLIGVSSGKVLEYDIRSKSCSICQYHFSRNETVPNHDCKINWSGSSKAMEPDMASSMLFRLQADGCNVQAIHADNDSTTAARLKCDFPSLEKKQDKNHLKKNISKQLYKLAKTYKQLKPAGTIPYVVRCFMYAVSSNDNSKLEPVVPHIFGDHSICIDAAWCTYHKNPSAYSYKHLSKGQPLSGDQLRKELDHIASNLQYMMQHINKLGSTQSNENFNNIVASKAPKNRSYGGTQSFFARVSAAVLQKNIGYSYIEKVNEDAQLSPGNFSRKHGILMDKKKLWNKKKHATITYKRKRITLKKRKHEKESTKYLKEGITYESNICNTETDQYDIQPIPGKRTFTGKEDMIVFDLETTGLSRCSDIIQLAAFDGKEDLNVYIYPSQPITRKASEITGISFNYNTQQMFYLYTLAYFIIICSDGASLK